MTGLKFAALAAFPLVFLGWAGANHLGREKAAPLSSAAVTDASGASLEAFETLLWTRDNEAPDVVDAIIDDIDANWSEAYIPMMIEVAVYGPSVRTSGKIFGLLRKYTGQDFGHDHNRWYQWLWNQPEANAPYYADFKANLYENIDPHFGPYFRGRQSSALIRLDEVRWGGVVQDGIPPLREPDMISARKAKYLDDDNIVFGIEINGDARAYPKRILAWHEMFVDTIGGVDIAGVYCTLCGTVIPYKTNFKGVNYQLGTSGFLYRSNKLMYDQKTQSLWNTLKGEPVIGPLAGKGIELEFLSVVTTTWGEWKRRHPDTKVLSLKTGHRRNYGEGVAYQEYFATDRLMFNTPFRDERLENKQEVLALRFAGGPQDQLAIDTDFLANHPIYTDQVGVQKVLVLTDATGANRVYDPSDVTFVHYDRQDTVTDDNGKKWRVTEEALLGPRGERLERRPYHRAFWFGWHAAFPDTRLVQG